MLIALFALCVASPPGDLIDPFASTRATGTPPPASPELRDPWAAPPREPPPLPSDLIDPFAVPPRDPPRTWPVTDLKNPFATTRGAVQGSPAPELKDPFAAVRRAGP